MTTVDDPGPIETSAIVRFVQTWRRAVERDLQAEPCPRPVEPRPECPDDALVTPVVVSRRPEREEVRDLAAAADRAVTTYPGPVGELVQREILAHLNFGHRFGNDTALVARLVRDVLGEESADAPPGARRPRVIRAREPRPPLAYPRPGHVPTS